MWYCGGDHFCQFAWNTRPSPFNAVDSRQHFIELYFKFISLPADVKLIYFLFSEVFS